MFGKKITFSSCSFWQSELWKEILISSGQCKMAEFINISNSRIVLVEVREVGLGFQGAFIIGFTGNFEKNDMDRVYDRIKLYSCIFLQVECIIGNISTSGNIPYRHFLEPYTRMIDLSRSEDEILAGMHEKCRYNIRLSEKRGVTVQSMVSNKENIDIWMGIVSETTTRDNFSHNSRIYYEKFLEELTKNDAGGLSFAFFDGKVIAAGIFVYFGDMALYYYGASVSDRELRKHMAPYLIQWHAIKEGKRRGCKAYDFLGIASPNDKKSHLRGVTEFKEKFGGDIYQLGDKKIFPLSWKYWIFISIRRLKVFFGR